jgi:hypothetical protein
MQLNRLDQDCLRATSSDVVVRPDKHVELIVDVRDVHEAILASASVGAAWLEEGYRTSAAQQSSDSASLQGGEGLRRTLSSG